MNLTERRRAVRWGGMAGVIWLLAAWLPIAELGLSSWFWLGPSAVMLAAAAIAGPILYAQSRKAGVSDSEGIESRDGDDWLPTVIPLAIMGAAVVLAFITSGAEPGCDQTKDPAWTDTSWLVVLILNVCAGIGGIWGLIRRRWFAVLLTLFGAFVCFFSLLVSFCWN